MYTLYTKINYQKDQAGSKGGVNLINYKLIKQLNKKLNETYESQPTLSKKAETQIYQLNLNLTIRQSSH